ncbi:hypothetical protein YC2023_040535 [Brassica napus]
MTRDEAYESISSSGSSLGVSAEIEEIKNATMGEATSLPEGSGLPLVGPVSVIGEDEVKFWRIKFHLPEDLVIRIPGPFETVSDFRAGEVPIYEGFFESGFRDSIPSLVAEVSRAVKTSSGQLNPPAWRILIAMQNLGDLEGLNVGVAEVMYCYSVSPLNVGENRYHLHPRGNAFPVREIPGSKKKNHPVFKGNWTSKFAFMSFSGFSSSWRASGESC